MRQEDEENEEEELDLIYLSKSTLNNASTRDRSRLLQKGSSDTLNPSLKHPKNVVREFPEEFSHLRVGGDFSDALICVDSRCFPVHRNILACCSPYFRALFTDLDRTTKSDKQPPPSPQPAAFDTGCSAGQHRPQLSRTFKDISHLLKRYDNRSTSNNQACDEANCARIFTRCYGPAKLAKINQLPQHDSAAVSCTAKDDVGCSVSQTQASDGVSSSPACCQVTIEGISADVMNSIIEHAYGLRNVVTSKNIEQLLPAADRFQVASLLKECCEFLLSEMTVGNCISIVKFSSNFFTCDDLRQRATQFLLEHFLQVFTESTEFEKLTAHELMSILRADRLNVKHEELVLDAVIRWVISDIPNRRSEIANLVQCSRVGLMHPDNMQALVEKWLHSSDLNLTFNSVTLQVMESVLECQKCQMETIDGEMFSPRLPRDVMFVIGGSNFGFPLNLVEVYDCRTCTWSVINPYEFAPRSYHGVVSLGQEIYIVGGFSGHVYLSSCCKFLPSSSAFEDVTPMNTKRCYVGVAVIQGNIYAVGGFDGVYRLNSAEKFTKDNNQWSFIPPMMHQRSDAGVAVLNDLLYVCGGFNGTDCIRAAEVYNPRTNSWSSIPGMPKGRSGLGLATYNGCLYAVGGFDGIDSSVRLSTAESYHPETRQWTRLENMPHPRSNLAVDVLEDVLYAIGGYGGDRTTSAVDCYNFATNSWHETVGLSHNRSALGVCVVSGLPNAAELLGRNREHHANFSSRSTRRQNGV